MARIPSTTTMTIRVDALPEFREVLTAAVGVAAAWDDETAEVPQAISDAIGRLQDALAALEPDDPTPPPTPGDTADVPTDDPDAEHDEP